MPPRPGPELLSEAIPLFFVGRNKNGFWVARESEGRIGGIFLLKRSALQFAQRNTPPWGCATMDVEGGFELDLENNGNPLIERVGVFALWLDRLRRRRSEKTGKM